MAEIPWEDHCAWYQQAARDPDKTILIACTTEGPACMVRFDHLGDGEAEISINMNPAVRGRGLGKHVLTEACAYGFERLGTRRLQARIKPTNAPSLRLFEGAGFVFHDERDGLLTYHLDGRGPTHGR
jgi:RimJ/RimL family protein N-acetyltransferase